MTNPNLHPQPAPAHPNEPDRTAETANASSSAAQLSLWDAVSLIVGIVVGSSIYRVSPLVFGNTSSPLAGLGIWLLGGVLSFLGALIYAELATTYPRCGGEYNYLSRAYGSWLGFLFAWSQLVIVQTASIGALAFVFADYARGLWNASEDVLPWIAGTAVVGLTGFNLLGLRAGARVQNGLTLLKLLGLAAMIVAGLVWGTADPWQIQESSASPPSWSFAFILVMYAYGGWSDAGFVAAEVRNVSQNVPRALLGGLSLITVIYLLINLAYLRGLGVDGLVQSERPAAAVLGLWLGPYGERVMSLLVMASALGGVNGLIFSTSRVHAMLGQDYRLFHALGGFSRRESPTVSLVAQCLITVLMLVSVGTESGQTLWNQILQSFGMEAIDWQYFGGGFNTLVAGSSPAFWLFFLLNAVGFLILRFTDRDRPRPFRVRFSPVISVIFAAVCGWMLYSSTTYAWKLLPFASVPILLGIPVYGLCLWYESAVEARSDSATEQ